MGILTRALTGSINHVFTIGIVVFAVVTGVIVLLLNSDNSSHVYTPTDPATGISRIFSNCELYETPIELDVVGSLPSWLEGSLFRNGPGKFDFPANTQSGKYHITHWFDGLTFLHKFSIKDGKVWYRNAEAAKALENYIAVHGNAPISFGPDPCKSVFNKISSMFSGFIGGPRKKRIANVGVTIKKIKNQYYGCTDAAILQQFDPDTLQVNDTFITTTDLHDGFADVGFDSFDGLSTAHGQYDAHAKEWTNVITRFGKTTTYNFVSVGDDPNRKPTLSDPISGPPVYLHSYAMTKNYYILQLHNAHLDLLKLLWNKEVTSSMFFNEKEMAKFYVVERASGKHISTFQTDPFFTFHNVNAWETEEGDIIMDLLQYKDISVIEDLHLGPFRTESGHPKVDQAVLTRYVLPSVADTKDANKPVTIAPSRIFQSTKGVELPRFHPQFHMKEYRFVYGIQQVRGEEVWDGISKVDIQTLEKKTWRGPSLYPAEPIFVPTPGGEGEDDGVLLSIVADVVKGSSFLVVLDAGTMEEIARAETPHIVPLGFHGNWYGETMEDDHTDVA